ncbi:MAG: hypothetical protein WEE89_14180 [Gemmatimonadota bacterium]
MKRLERAFTAGGNRAGRVVVIEGTGHSLMDHETHELHARFVSLLAQWLRNATPQPG